MVVEKSVLMKVVLPRPDSPATLMGGGTSVKPMPSRARIHVRTMIVKAAPLLATILCRWLGKLAMPIGDALSAAVGGILEICNDARQRDRTREDVSGT